MDLPKWIAQAAVFAVVFFFMNKLLAERFGTGPLRMVK